MHSWAQSVDKILYLSSTKSLNAEFGIISIIIVIIIITMERANVTHISYVCVCLH